MLAFHGWNLFLGTFKLVIPFGAAYIDISFFDQRVFYGYHLNFIFCY